MSSFSSHYADVFRPSAPIRERKKLYGREQELRDLERALARPGHHPIVIGNRGVGKTSLVKVALRERRRVIRLNCDEQMTFDSFAKHLLHKLGVATGSLELTQEITKEVKGGGQLPLIAKVDLSGSQKDGQKQTFAPVEKYTASRLFDALCEIEDDHLVVLDEFDRINRLQPVFYGPFSDLLKACSDNYESCRVRFLVVGIAYNAQELLGKHESIERCVIEIFVRPLRREDVREFLEDAQTELRFQFTEDVVRQLLNDADGYPYFIHLICLYTLDVMQEEDDSCRTVSLSHYVRGVARAVERNARSALRKYYSVAEKVTEAEREFLWELALVSRLGRPVQRIDFQKRLAQKGIIPPKLFDRTLVTLQQKYHVVFLGKTTDQIKFKDPLMAPFLRFYLFGEKSTSPIDNPGQLSLPLEDGRPSKHGDLGASEA